MSAPMSPSLFAAPPGRRLSLLLTSAIVAALPIASDAAQFASRVISYTPAVAEPDLRNPETALGSPDGLTGENPLASRYFGFPNVLSPFSPAYQGDEIVGIGEGGQITLQLSHFAIPGPGREIGIFSNFGLRDADYPNGTNSNPASTFGLNRPIDVQVSADGITFVPAALNLSLEHPTLFYTNAGPYDTTPPANPELANFGIPFEGTLSSFNGKNYADTLATFDTPSGHSAGGTWIDLSSTGLSQIGFIRLSLDQNVDAAVDIFHLDAISIADSALGSPVPEPSTACLMIAMGALFLRRRRR